LHERYGIAEMLENVASPKFVESFRRKWKRLRPAAIEIGDDARIRILDYRFETEGLRVG